MINKKQVKKQGIKTIESNNTISEQKNAKLEALKKLIPNLVNADNQINTQALNDFIDITNTTSNNKGYELTFAGKSIARAKADIETTKELKVEEKQSKNFDTTENVVIRGDNLDVLKILKQNYFEKIKMIYIDPPYNTKSENFIYNDNFKQSEQALIENLGLGEETSNFLHNVYGTRSHSGWLAFMYPRLKLARDLLKEDGVIFISIDDNEQANLKIMCDEIFGDENLISILKIQVRYDNKSLNEKKDFQEVQEYVFMYGKNSTQCEFNKPTEEYSLNNFEFGIEHNKVPTKTIVKNGRKMDIWLKNDFLIKKVKNPSEKYFKKTWITGSIYSNTGHGAMYKKMIEDRIKEDDYNCLYRIYGIGEDGLGYRYYANPKEKKYNKGKMYTKIPLNKLDDIKQGKSVQKENPIIGYSDFSADFGNIRHEGGINFNSGKKPVKMLQQFIQYQKNKNDIVLDFFAGSGTTGDAVMQLNREDDGNRKFVLVQWDEQIKKDTEAYKFCTENNFEPIISSITIERLNRAGEKIKTEWEAENKKQQNFLIKEEVKPLPDIGYKVYSLTEKPKLIEENKNQIDAFTLINKRKNTTDTLINMLCATCKPLHTKIAEIIKDKLYLADGELYVIANIDSSKLEKKEYKDIKINIDGYSDISLENWLNLDIINKENISVIY